MIDQKGMTNSDPKKLFVVIVTYNGKKWIHDCLSSIQNHSVIVVDNCSEDGTKKLIKSAYPEVTLLEQKENLGFGIANNIGISYALQNNADYVFLLNQDAMVEPQTLSSLLKISWENPEYGILSPVHLNFQGNGLEKVFGYYIGKERSDHLLSDILLNKPIRDVYSYRMINAAAWLIPRQTLETVGGFHPMFFLYGEDDNYCQRVLYHGLKIGVCPNTFIRHDSNHCYHGNKKKGSKEYYTRFLNKIKVEYANVNRQDDEGLENLNKKYLQDAFKSLIKLDLREMKINLHKRKLIQHLDFSEAIKEGRMKGRNHLDTSD